ncbi:MAG: hypothetical protein HY815_18610 [Candidatus Riflebacteria bacterium]|nr:hypothetical protein [Candidatus Riflebacteria bacterium]
MRRQDELIALYPSQSRLARKFLLSQMEGLALTFDSEELLEFLQGQVCDDDPILRDQALFSLARFLPDFVQRRYAVAASTAGVWTGYQMDGSNGALKVVEQADGWSWSQAVLTVSRLRCVPVRDWVFGAADRPGPEMEVGLALSSLESREALDRLVALVRREAVRSSSLLLLLSLAAGQAAFDLLVDSIDRTDAAGRMSLAFCLPAFPEQDCRAAMDRLLGFREGWVQAAVLGSAEALAAPALVPWLADVYKTSENEFIRIQAVKAAGGIAGDLSVQLCLDAAGKGTDAVRAVALESLVRLRVEGRQLREAATPLLGSPHLKARVNAMLGALAPEETFTTPAFRELLMSSDALSRLEAAYCLGYLQSGKALEYLGALAAADPCPGVRLQSIKSLSKYPARDSVPYLLELTPAEEPRVALTAARVMTRYDGEEAGHTCGLIAQAIAQGALPFRKALLYRALGAVAGKSLYPHARQVLIEGLSQTDPTVLAGVIEGWNLLGAATDPELPMKLLRLSAEGDPRLRARANVARWHCGDVAAVEELARMVLASDEKTAGPALDCVMEMGLLLPTIATAPRFKELAQKLLSLPGQAGADAFTTREPAGPLAGENPPEARKAPLRSEVDFAIKRPPRRPGFHLSPRAGDAVASPVGSSPRLSVPVPADDSGSAGVAQFQEFLSRLAQESSTVQAIRERLERVSYLVTDQLPDPSTLSALLKRALRPIALALGLVVAALLVRAGCSTAPRPLDLGLTVSALAGSADMAKKPLATGQTVGPGSLVSTGSGGELVLVTPGGNRISLKPSSSVRFDGALSGRSSGAAFRFVDPRGEAEFEFTSGEALELVFGATRITSGRAVLRVGVTEGNRTVTVRSGKAQYESKTESSPLRAGDTVTVR